MRKIVFFDVDGTIVTDVYAGEGKYVPDSCKKAIKQARENGHLCFINSGRPYMNIEPYIKAIGFDGIVSGCGTNIHVGDEEIFYVTVEKSIADMALELCKRLSLTAFFEGRDKTYYIENGYRVDWLEEFAAEIVKTGSCVLREADEDFGFDKFCAFHKAGDDISEFVEKMSEYFSIIVRDETFMELVPKGHTKGTAIKRLCEHYDIPLCDSYAIGDSLNDLDMFLATPNSIAMGNGKALHEYASFVTRDITDDGIEYALKHYDII